MQYFSGCNLRKAIYQFVFDDAYSFVFNGIYTFVFKGI